MNFTIIVILSVLTSILGLIAIYSTSPKKFELKIINNELMVILYSTYFLLPFTTKIKKYKNIKNAYIRKRIKREKYDTYFVYDLLLESSKWPITIISGRTEYEELEEYCDNINQSIASFKEYSFDICIGKWRTFIILIMGITPLIMMLAYTSAQDFNYSRDIEFQYFMYVYLATITIIAVAIMLSLMVNRSIASKKRTDVISSVNYSKEKNIEEKNRDMNSEAQRMYDSIIK